MQSQSASHAVGVAILLYPCSFLMYQSSCIPRCWTMNSYKQRRYIPVSLHFTNSILSYSFSSLCLSCNLSSSLRSLHIWTLKCEVKQIADETATESLADRTAQKQYGQAQFTPGWKSAGQTQCCGNHQTQSPIVTQVSKALSRQSSRENHKRTRQGVSAKFESYIYKIHMVCATSSCPPHFLLKATILYTYVLISSSRFFYYVLDL